MVTRLAAIQLVKDNSVLDSRHQHPVVRMCPTARNRSGVEGERGGKGSDLKNGYFGNSELNLHLQQYRTFIDFSNAALVTLDPILYLQAILVHGI
jgi:hypothetical protein